MKAMKFMILGILALMILSVLGGAGAQDDYQAAMAKAATPGKPHEFLASLCGTWNVVVKSWMQPGQEPIVSKGRTVSKMVLGGRYTMDETRMETGQAPMEGIGLSGYDNTKGEYFMVWIDNMGTGMILFSGQPDAAGKVMTMTGTFTDPVSKQVMSMRIVTTYFGADKYTSEFFMLMPDGSEFRTMEMTGEREK